MSVINLQNIRQAEGLMEELQEVRTKMVSQSMFSKNCGKKTIFRHALGQLVPEGPGVPDVISVGDVIRPDLYGPNGNRQCQDGVKETGLAKRLERDVKFANSPILAKKEQGGQQKGEPRSDEPWVW